MAGAPTDYIVKTFTGMNNNSKDLDTLARKILLRVEDKPVRRVSAAAIWAISDNYLWVERTSATGIARLGGRLRDGDALR
jgi:hypothetical protein